MNDGLLSRPKYAHFPWFRCGQVLGYGWTGSEWVYDVAQDGVCTRYTETALDEMREVDPYTGAFR